MLIITWLYAKEIDITGLSCRLVAGGKTVNGGTDKRVMASVLK